MSFLMVPADIKPITEALTRQNETVESEAVGVRIQRNVNTSSDDHTRTETVCLDDCEGHRQSREIRRDQFTNELLMAVGVLLRPSQNIVETYFSNEFNQLLHK